MWSAAIGAIVLVAGMVVSKMLDSNTYEPSESADEPLPVKIEALKAIRESAYQRWEKRRTFEWQICLSIWTALAAFCAIVISKDFPIAHRGYTSIAVLVVGVAVTLLHRSYVLRMYAHTIGDVHLQRWAEKQIFRTTFGSEMPTCDTGCEDYPFHPPMTKKRRIQSYITLTLAIAGAVAVLAPRDTPQPDKTTVACVAQSAPVPFGKHD